jgi:hypothetical protein
MKRLNCEEIPSKSSAISAQDGGILYWPAYWVAYKRKLGVQLFQRRMGAFCTGLPTGLPIKENWETPVSKLQPMIDTATPFVDTT